MFFFCWTNNTLTCPTNWSLSWKRSSLTDHGCASGFSCVVSSLVCTEHLWESDMHFDLGLGSISISSCKKLQLFSESQLKRNAIPSLMPSMHNLQGWIQEAAVGRDRPPPQEVFCSNVTFSKMPILRSHPNTGNKQKCPSKIKGEMKCKKS